MKKKIEKRLKKLSRRKEEINRDRPDPEKVERFYQIGCSLLSRGCGMCSGHDLEVLNHFSGEMLCVPVVKGETFIQAAERYFRKSKKEKKRIENFHKQLSDIKTRKEYYRELLFQIDSEIDFTFLDTLSSDLFKKGRPDTKNRKKGKFTRFTIRCDGLDWLCYLSKNAVQNEKLLSNVARSEDFWFHSFEVPGGHIVVKNSDRRKSLPGKVREIASKVAGYFSRFRNDEYAVIATTQIKYLSRPPAHPPGFVIMNKFSTERVRTEKRDTIDVFLNQHKKKI